MNKRYCNPLIEEVHFAKDLSDPVKKLSRGHLSIDVPMARKIAVNVSKEKFEKIALCKIRGEADGHWLRARSEMLLLRGDEVYILEGSEEICSQGLPVKYTVPGGGWSKHHSRDERYRTAIKETEEEAGKKVKHVRYANNYIIYDERKHKDRPCSRSKDKVKQKYRWYGYYTEVFVGEYAGHYHGPVNPLDRDPKFRRAHFYPIEEVIGKLRKEHQETIRMYRKEFGV